MSDHTIMIILVMKIFFVQFFCVFLPSLLNLLLLLDPYHSFLSMVSLGCKKNLKIQASFQDRLEVTKTLSSVIKEEGEVSTEGNFLLSAFRLYY